MKRIWTYGILLLTFVLFTTGCKFKPKDNADEVVNENIDKKVLEVFNLTNEFRTGSEAFYLNEDNVTNTSKVGKLGKLILDNDLCKAAQVRSNEIVESFSHTRPNGTSCSTVLKEFSITTMGSGENIAAGNESAKATFLQWKEDGKPYSGQGHRRIMLGDYTRIGIAYTYAPGSTYGYYWTMILVK